MSQVNNIVKDIKNKKLAPIYFLMGDEPFYIDLISKTIEDEVLTEDEKAFNQNILYGNEVSIADITGMAKQFPMGATHQVVIVKEAQHLSRTIDDLEAYAENPQPSTVLVINYKGKPIDKRKKLYKTLQKHAVIEEFKKIYEDKVPAWIESTAQSLGMQIDPKSRFLMAEFLGTDLGRIYNELHKLKIVATDGKITPEIVEKNIGISKDFNNFELRKAIETKNSAKAFQIVHYFAQNPKDNPLILTTMALYSGFINIILYHIATDKSQSALARELGVHPYFVNDVVTAARNYPLKKATRIVSLIRETDVKSKGVGASGNVSHGDLLKELIVKIFTI